MDQVKQAEALVKPHSRFDLPFVPIDLPVRAGYAVCLILGGHLLGGSLVRGARQGFLLTGGKRHRTEVL